MERDKRVSKEPTEAIPPEQSQDIKQVLTLPPYKLASFLANESLQSNGGCVSLVLDSLAAISPIRAALALCDLSSLRLAPRPGEIGCRAQEELKEIIQSCRLFGEIRAELLTLPTLDAMRCRRDLLKLQDHHTGDPTLIALYAVAAPQYYLPTFLRREVWFDNRAGWNESALHRHYAKLARESWEPVSAAPELSEHNRQILHEFQEEISPTLFPIERYGYGSVADVLECAPIDQDMWGDRDVWGFVNLWAESPDETPSRYFQCADSAPTARSFFVARGIPADVYVLSIGGIFHNVCIVFFEEHRAEYMRTVPVLVDATPYNGLYRIEPGHRELSADILNPIDCAGVYSQRKKPLAFVGGDRLAVTPTGLAPWSCQELKSGRARVFTFGGVTAQQKQTGWIVERGTPEYHGNGIRAPRPEVTLYVAPTSGDRFEQLRSGRPFIACGYHQEGGTATLHHCSMSTSKEQEISELRAELLEELQPIATEHLSQVEKMIARFSYPLDERAFHRRR